MTLADAPAPRRFKLTMAYDGTRFHGWQKQEPIGQPPLRTVAGVIEAALVRLMRQPINLVGASRTDAGVHARGQVAHFDVTTSIPVDRLAAAVNSRMPDDIEVLRAQPAEPWFDAIADAIAKQYRYRLFNTHHKPLEKRHFVSPCWWRLDVDRMNDAARRLIGEHDFAGFAAAGHGRATTVRTIHDCRVESHREKDEVHVVVTGNGFLYNMVRILAGTLVDIGRGHREPARIDRVLASGDRRHAGTTLPPQGLWLEWIRYADEPWPGTGPVKHHDPFSAALRGRDASAPQR